MGASTSSARFQVETRQPDSLLDAAEAMPWAMFRANPRHTGRTAVVGAQSATEQWTWRPPVGQAVGAPAVATDGTVYVRSARLLHAIRPSGTLLWQVDVGESFYSWPAIGRDGTIYVAGNGCPDTTSTACVTAVSPIGEVRWRYPTRYIEATPTVGDDGTIYVQSDDFPAGVYAIYPSGLLRWFADVQTLAGSSGSTASAIGSDGSVYVGMPNNGVFVAFNEDGSPKWATKAHDSGGVFGDSAPAIASDGAIYVGGGNSPKLYTFEPTGAIKWATPLPPGADVFGSPAIDALGDIYVGNVANTFFALRPDGTIKWSADIGAVRRSSAPYLHSHGLQPRPEPGERGAPDRFARRSPQRCPMDVLYHVGGGTLRASERRRRGPGCNH
jgi:outer membrane protein assembly factor BamB